MKKKWKLVGYLVLLAALALAVDVTLAAMIALHPAERTIVELRSNAG
jgi:hypothetical protein